MIQKLHPKKETPRKNVIGGKKERKTNMAKKDQTKITITCKNIATNNTNNIHIKHTHARTRTHNK